MRGTKTAAVTFFGPFPCSPLLRAPMRCREQPVPGLLGPQAVVAVRKVVGVCVGIPVEWSWNVACPVTKNLLKNPFIPIPVSLAYPLSICAQKMF